MDASPLRVPGGKTCSHVHWQGTSGARAACSCEADGAEYGSSSTGEREAFAASRLLEETEELELSDREE
jgi:hypothetical protein